MYLRNSNVTICGVLALTFSAAVLLTAVDGSLRSSTTPQC